jgi:hypothetical protein
MAQVTRKGVYFSSRINSDSTEIEKYNVRQNATIEHAEVRFYPGAQLDLQLKLEVVDENGTSKEIVDPQGEKDYIAGDDDFFKFNISVPIEKEDEIRIIAENTDQNGNAYDYVVNMELDRVGGIERIVNKIGGIF